MIEEQALTEVADVLCSYLPASGAPYTFGEAARDAGAGVTGERIAFDARSRVPGFVVEDRA